MYFQLSMFRNALIAVVYNMHQQTLLRNSIMFHPMILRHSEHDSYFNLDTVPLNDLKSGELEHARSGSAAMISMIQLMYCMVFR